MTKSELKTGMIVILRNKKEYMVFKDVRTSYCDCDDVLVATDLSCNWHRLSNYNEDLIYSKTYTPNWDIVEVLRVYHPYNLLEPNKCGYTDRELLWKRQEKKKYTYAQLREILGEEFEVVG